MPNQDPAAPSRAAPPHPLGADRRLTAARPCGPAAEGSAASPAGADDQGLLALAAGLVPGAKPEAAVLAALLDGVAQAAPGLLEALKRQAAGVLAEHRGNTVYYRGLLEFSNLCARDCLYCGIRAGNRSVERFSLSLDEIGETARWCAANGYGSVTLQSGERQDPAFLHYVEQAIVRIKAESLSAEQPEGLGITLCVGELDEAALLRMKAAGAHRYLLRVETTNPQLYARLHPGPDGGLEQRVANLRLLKRLGFQVGTGVMIGLPGQSSRDLAQDLHFFYDEGVQMIGMGPYIPHQNTPLGSALEEAGASALLPDRQRFELGLAMVALARIMLPKANIAATTALQALHPFGRELGLDAGANILMPLVTPQRVREHYQLYDNKPCVDDELDECRDCLAARVATTRRAVGYHRYGDSLIPVAPPLSGPAPGPAEGGA